MSRKILIYDHGCTYCKAFVRLLHRFDRQDSIRTIGYDAPAAQALLKAQFGTHFGFSMYFFEQERVSWGREAAENVSRSLSMPRFLSRSIFHLYPTLVSLVSKLTRRQRQVCGPECFGAANVGSEKMNASLTEDTMNEIAFIFGNESESSGTAQAVS